MTAGGGTAGQGGSTGAEPAPALSPEQERSLAHEAFMSRALELREGARRRSGNKETSIAALTGVFTLLGVLLSGIVTQCSQRAGKSFEVALAEHEAEKRLRRDAMDSLNAVITAMNHASGERVSMARAQYDDMDDSTIHRHERSANDADTRWEKEQEAHEFRLQLYYTDTLRLLPAWRTARTAIEHYAVCASRAMARYSGKRAPDSTCAAARDSAFSATHGLRTALVRSYRAFDSAPPR